jgi:hypothetical protein
MFVDYIVRQVDGYGFLPIVVVNGQEIYRGEYRLTFREAVIYAEEAGYNYSVKDKSSE